MLNFHESKQDDLRMLDKAIDMHIEWTRCAFRCAVLNKLPKPSMMREDAHLFCEFGQWLNTNIAKLELFNAEKAAKLEEVHQQMHSSIREIFLHFNTKKRVTASLLDQFERSQSEVISLLNYFKTRFITNALQYDSLTGLPLRYGLNDQFNYLKKLAQQRNHLFFLALMDIDHFKKVNDTYGHQVGDEALIHLANLLRAATGDKDFLYRFGGEEFLILFETKSLDLAQAFSYHLNQTLREQPLQLKNHDPIPLTVTIGVALVQENDSFDTALERADQALYRGKNAGRDRYQLV